MPIQDISAQEPSLRHLGIRIQAAQPSAAETADSLQAAEIDQQERLTLAGLQLQQFEQAYVIRPGAQSNPIVIDPERISTENLMGSLQQLGQRLDLNTALDLHGAASTLIASMRQQNELAEDEPLTLVLKGAFGEIELDLERFKPEALRKAFNTGLAEQNAGELQAVHTELAGLSQLIRAGFDDEAGVAQLESWLSAIEPSSQSFDLGSLFSQALGYNPLNEESSVRHLLQALSAQGSELSSEFSSEQAEALNAKAQLAQLIADKVNALIEAANRLEAELELSPSPNAPDIMELIKAFQAIIRQLDQDIYKILAEQNKLKRFERKLLSQFAERLHRNLRFHQEQLQGFQRSAVERLNLLLRHSQAELQAKIWLLQQSSDSPQPVLNQAFKALD